MRNTIPLVFLIALICNCGDSSETNLNNTGTDHVNSRANNANSTNLDGKALYDKHCASCHGPDAAGGAVWAGSIQGYQPIVDLVNDGRNTMPPVAVTEAENAAIQTYLLSFGAEDLSGLNGKEVYDKKCATCHGDQGQGTELGYPLQFVNPELATWVIRNGREPLEFESGMPSYPETQISLDQINEMIIFLHSGPRPPDGKGLYIAFCGNCHGPDALGGYSKKKIASRAEAMEIVRSGKGSNIAARGLFMPAWKTSHLIDEEVRLIEAYTGSLQDN